MTTEGFKLPDSTVAEIDHTLVALKTRIPDAVMFVVGRGGNRGCQHWIAMFHMSRRPEDTLYTVPRYKRRCVFAYNLNDLVELAVENAVSYREKERKKDKKK